jgi:hypothetical protein
MKWKLALVLLILSVILVGFIGFRYYSYVFAKTVQGEVVGVERVVQPAAIINNSNTPPSSAQMFSFAIAVRDAQTGEIFTGSSEDRQWAVVQKGQCAIAKFFPYPFWELDKAGTYYGTRLIQLFDCSKLPMGSK